MDLFYNLYCVLLKPTETFERFAKEYNTNLLIQGIVAYLIATLIDNQLSVHMFIDSVMVWFITVTLIFLTGYVFKLKRSDYGKIICLCSFANLPLIFTAPLKLIADYHEALFHWLSIALLIWIINLYIVAISKACDIRRRKVIIFFSIPIIGIAMLLIASLTQILLTL